MTRNTEFHDYILHDVLAHIPNVTSKSMFGGWGIYYDGIIFGIITSENILYFKVNEKNMHEYLEYGSEPFIFRGYAKRPPLVMKYWSVPEEILEDSEKISTWVEKSLLSASQIKKK